MLLFTCIYKCKFFLLYLFLFVCFINFTCVCVCDIGDHHRMASFSGQHFVVSWCWPQHCHLECRNWRGGDQDKHLPRFDSVRVVELQWIVVCDDVQRQEDSRHWCTFRRNCWGILINTMVTDHYEYRWQVIDIGDCIGWCLPYSIIIYCLLLLFLMYTISR